MASVAKKPPVTGGRETPTGTPSRSTPRGAGTASPGAMPRRSSLRTPISARAAASHQRRESLLSTSSTNIVPNSAGSGSANLAANSASAPGPAGSNDDDEAARAEALAVLDDIRERLARAEAASNGFRRQAEVLQSRLDDALKEHAKLEEKMHEAEEHIETLANEKREAARQMREMETIYEAERSAMMREKDEMANRDEETQAVIRRLKDNLTQRSVDEDRPARQVNGPPSLDSGNFAPPTSIQRSDSKNNSKLLLQKDKLIESLRLELAEAQIKLVESENQGGGRLHDVERMLMEARMANARLMEDNESYQLLLQERTLKGDFGTSDFSYMNGGSGGASSNQDALAALEGRTTSSGLTSLADELSEMTDDTDTAVPSEAEHSEVMRRLEGELKAVKDQNKALTLYINKIIERLLQHQDFEHILDQSNDLGIDKPNINKDLPPPPGKTGPSLLQRAKSIAIGGRGSSPGKPRQRPMSFMPSAAPAAESAHTNPDTAPSIPIGLPRSTSTRRAGRPMSEQFTGTGAANIVNAMYKGGPERPLSPGLRSQTFFIPGREGSIGSPGGGGAGSRSSSGGGTAAGIPVSSSGNFPGMRSETSSTSSDAGGGRGSGSGGVVGGGGDGESVTTTSSPPRSHHEKKDTTTFAGNKPRQLRLVQENPEAVAGAAAHNKRQSWIGWASTAFSGAKKDGEVVSVTSEIIHE